MEDPEVKQHIDELDKEAEFRQRLVQARKDAGIHQKTIYRISNDYNHGGGTNEVCLSKIRGGV